MTQFPLGLAVGLAQALGAEYLSLTSLSAGDSPASHRSAGGLTAEMLADSVRAYRTAREVA
jgi:hypothetical protein